MESSSIDKPPFFFSSTLHPDSHVGHTDSSSSNQFHVVTVSDTGRNWSDQEVRALIQVWSDERISRQLESSTRKRDIFVQISNRLMQQGIERDWKQCHTKYKNLKYLYRSLQRSRTDEADPRSLMRFYDDVDAIMKHSANGSPQDAGPADAAHSRALEILQVCEENHQDSIYLKKSNAEGATDERTFSSDSVSSVATEVASNADDLRLHPNKEKRLDRQQKRTSETIIIYSLIKVCQ